MLASLSVFNTAHLILSNLMTHESESFNFKQTEVYDTTCIKDCLRLNPVKCEIQASNISFYT